MALTSPNINFQDTAGLGEKKKSLSITNNPKGIARGFESYSKIFCPNNKTWTDKLKAIVSETNKKLV